jgi:hypothetical protein
MLVNIRNFAYFSLTKAARLVVLLMIVCSINQAGTSFGTCLVSVITSETNFLLHGFSTR